METFIQQNKELVWVVLVLLFTLFMIFVSTKTLHLVERKLIRSQRYTSVFVSLRRISRAFFVILGIGLISYLFVNESTYAIINQNILRIIWIALVIMVTVILAAFSKGYFYNKIERLSRRDQGDVTLYKYLNYLSTAIIYLIGFILIAATIPALSNFATAAGASAGVFALIAGVAAQEGISNLIGGLFIAFFKPFRIGDIVKIGPNIMGRVEDVNLRHTVINNFQNKRIVIPNAIVNKENIVNYYLGEFKICEWIEVGISYDSDMDKAMKIVRETCEAHPLCMDNRTPQEKEKGDAKVDVQVVSLGQSSVQLKAWVWAASYQTAFNMRNQLYKTIKERFDQEGIEIPFPHTTVVLKNKTTPA